MLTILTPKTHAQDVIQWIADAVDAGSTNDIINELREESSEFKTVWDELYAKEKLRFKKEGGMFVIDHTVVYDAFFSKMSYSTQAVIIEKVLLKYSDEVSGNIRPHRPAAHCQCAKPL